MDEVLLLEVLDEDRILVGLRADGRTEALAGLIALLPLAGEEERAAVLRSVLEREGVQTTGIGEGIAVPHGKADIGPPVLAALGIAPDGVDFGSVDGEPVRIIVLIVSRTDVAGPHVRALAGVGRLLGGRRLREDLLSCRTAAEVLERIGESAAE